MAGESTKGTRVIALVGPAGAGKTSLAEAMLFAAGATDRLGSTANGSSIGDFEPGSAPARRLDRAQPLQFRLSRRLVRNPRLPRLDRLRRRRRAGAGDRRCRDRRRRSRSRPRAARRPCAARARRARHPAPHLRQPHRPGARPHPRPPVRAPADQRVAADRPPDSDLGRREGQRLRRSGARTCVQISPRPAIRADRNSRPSFRTARSRRAPTCSSSSPTMTTSCSSNC